MVALLEGWVLVLRSAQSIVNWQDNENDGRGREAGRSGHTHTVGQLFRLVLLQTNIDVVPTLPPPLLLPHLTLHVQVVHTNDQNTTTYTTYPMLPFIPMTNTIRQLEIEALASNPTRMALTRC